MTEYGQTPALPLDNVVDEEYEVDETSGQVQAYLKAVRNDAQNDAPVYFKKSEDAIKPIEPSSIDPTHIDEGLLAWNKSVINELLTLKSNRHIKGSDAVDLPQTANEWRKFILENDLPSLDFFYSLLDHSTAFKLVVYCTKWLNISTSEHLSKWIWYLFVRIDNTLDPNEISVLRDLGKKACKLLLKVTDETNEITQFTISMIITVVANYYGQKDLLECNLG